VRAPEAVAPEPPPFSPSMLPCENGEDAPVDVCAKCGNQFLDDSVHCRKCGAPRPNVCECGNILKVDSEFCRKCGKKREDERGQNGKQGKVQDAWCALDDMDGAKQGYIDQVMIASRRNRHIHNLLVKRYRGNLPVAPASC